MQEHESNNNDLDGKLRDYFRAEDRGLEAPPGLWDAISPRLGEQRRPGWRRRLLAASISMPFWAPEARKALAVGMVLVVAVGLVYFGVSLVTDGDVRPDTADTYEASRAVPYQESAEAASRPAAPTTPRPQATGLAAGRDPAFAMVGTLGVSVVGDELAFDTTSLSVDSGTEVTVTFSNPSSVNTHNFVVVQPGTKDSVAADGTAAGPDNNWVPPGDSRVIANTVLIGPGESTQLTFTAPAAGTYQFVCTFPGHNFTMFGDFTVN